MPEGPQPAPQSPLEPARFSAVIDHELIRLIGRGSYGEVWLAKNSLGTYRAVKIVHEKTFRHRRPFDREFNGVQKFEPVSRLHEGLVDILHVGRNEAAGYFYCVMELADDVASGQSIDPENYSPRTLAHDLGQQRRLPTAHCRSLGVTIAQALGFLHDRGLIHRDVKPSNIVFVNGIPKLADIGLVAEMSEARSYVGTEGFIPPEGPGTVQSDIYSLGKVLYEISTGKDRHDFPDLPTHLGDPAEKQELSELNRIILTACRPDPAQRYKTAAAIATDLAGLPDGNQLLVQRKVRRFKRAFLAAATAGLTIAGILIVQTRMRTGPTPPELPLPLPAPEGLVAWWRGEENGADSAGNNPVTDLAGVGFGPGKAGQGFSFDGQEHRMIVSNAPALNFGPDEDFSIEGWVRPFHAETALGLMPIVCKQMSPREAEGLGYEFSLFNGKLHLGMSDRLGRFAFSNFGHSGPDLRDGQFHHVAATVQRNSRTGGRLYVDGKLIHPFDPTGHRGDLSNTNALCIGHNPAASNTFFKGTIDEIALYKRALSAAEIQSVYLAGAAGKFNPRLNSASFAAKFDLPAGNGPLQVIAADFNGDGRCDLAAAAAYAHKVSIYRNAGTNGSPGANSFDVSVDLSIGAGVEDPLAIAAGDVDGDGKIDLLVCHRQANAVAVFKNNSSIATLEFASPVSFAAGLDPTQIAVEDLNADGRPDVIAVNNRGDTVSLLRNSATRGTIDAGSFVHEADLPAGSRPHAIAVGDLDADGKPDLVIGNIGDSTLSVFRNIAVAGTLNAGPFAPGFNLPVPTNTTSVVIGDLDRDGKPDLVLGSSNFGRTVSVYRNISPGNPLSADSFAPRVDIPAGAWVNSLALGDFDGDRRPDIVLATQSPDRMSLFQNLSTPGTFDTNSLGPRLDFPSNWNAIGIAVADLDGDHFPDAVFGNAYSSTISIYRNCHASKDRR